MGEHRWSTQDWTETKTFRSTKSTEQIFTQRGQVHPDLDPKKIILRESCDSQLNPTSTPIILGLDVTGSMGMIADAIAREQLGTLVQGILDRKPVPDPHIMVMGIGDVHCDKGPFQASQFEADIKISDQLANLWLEKGGGSNDTESYHIPWYFAGKRTKIDSFEKRKKKGYLFTFGDENPPLEGLRKYQIERVFGPTQEQDDYTTKELLELAKEKYEVFHLIVEQGSHCRYGDSKERVTKRWRELMGKRAVLLKDYHHLSEVILSIIEVSEGIDPDSVMLEWQNASIKESIHHALYD